VTAAEFLAVYPEFRSVGTDQLVATLAQAALSVDRNIFGAKADAAIGTLAGHLLWGSPYGASLRVTTEAPDESPYLQEFKRLSYEVAPRMFVT
jgi:hypothetical protein